MQNIAPNRNEHDTRDHFNHPRGADLHPASVILYVGGGFWKREGINIPLHHVTFDRVRAVNLAMPSVIDAAEELREIDEILG